MNQESDQISCIYVAASRNDARFTRICIASIRSVYDSIPVKLLVGGPLERGLRKELADHWEVGVLELPEKDYGWGFVKLEPLFLEHEERFLVLDSDTVMAGPVLDYWRENPSSFLVDDEIQEHTEIKRLYYDWERPELEGAGKPEFVFNSGQWFGTSGRISREDFEDVLRWETPPQLRFPEAFMPGDQGVFNYVLNRKASAGLDVTRKTFMHWPGHGMSGFSAAEVQRGGATPSVIHWAGMKKHRLASMVGSDVLVYFESVYYAHIPHGWFLRRWRALRYVLQGLTTRLLAGIR